MLKHFTAFYPLEKFLFGKIDILVCLAVVALRTRGCRADKLEPSVKLKHFISYGALTDTARPYNNYNIVHHLLG